VIYVVLIKISILKSTRIVSILVPSGSILRASLFSTYRNHSDFLSLYLIFLFCFTVAGKGALSKLLSNRGET